MPHDEAHAGLAYEPLRDLLIDVARERGLEDVLRLIVTRLAELPEVALARIWLLDVNQNCPTCRRHRLEAEEKPSHLHLVASDGRSVVDSSLRWDRIDGGFHLMAPGERKVGVTASTGRPHAVWDIEQDANWIAHPDWAGNEGIRSFAGQPLLFRGEVLGVLGVFRRAVMQDDCLLWTGILADHAAAAIAHARAFREIDRLRQQLALENEYLREEVTASGAFGEMIGQSAALRRIHEQVDLLAPTDAGVLILGESGTGKELVAREIHHRSSRAAGPLIKVNCAAIPRDLYESEFFGHMKGAFTGAVRDRAGRFEAADGGTLFLDEVGEIPLDLQAKLLRVLQEGAYERVGEEDTRSVDVRIIAATNRDLSGELDQGRFRQDLYFRLNVFPIEVPPLRRRKEDIPALAQHFLDVLCRRNQSEPLRLTQGNAVALQSYDWPGNIRELQNVMERAAITSRGGRLRLDLPDGSNGGRASSPSRASRSEEVLTEEQVRAIERDNTLRVLEQTNWKVSGTDGAAALLGVKPTTLTSRIRKLGLERAP